MRNFDNEFGPNRLYLCLRCGNKTADIHNCICLQPNVCQKCKQKILLTDEICFCKSRNNDQKLFTEKN